VNAIEARALLNNLPVPQDGLKLRIGALDGDNRLAVGPLWRYSGLANGRLEVDASAAMSVEADRDVAGAVHLPHLWDDRLRVSFTAGATELPEGHFYGLGPTSEQSHLNSFELGRRSLGTGIRFSPASSLSIDATTGLLSTHLRNLGGLDFAGGDLNFLHSRVAVAYDDRNEPAHPHRGGRYYLALHRFRGPSQAWTSFARVDTELEQHVPVWHDRHTVTMRLSAVFTDADAGHDVPFYLLPTLGGARWLRGFDHERFRDRNAVVMQAEYGWDVSRTLGAVVFYERGTVARRVSDFKLSNMRSDYGVGLRLGSPRFVAVRTDVAFGSGEGTRVVVRFGHGI
jgi:outer membrane protein assembly factor BamA